MFLTELISLTVVVLSLAACFLASVGGTFFLMNRVVQATVVYLERSMELRHFEAETRIESARLQGSIPAWVDRKDPMEVAAWNRAVAETWRISARHALSDVHKA